MKQATHAAMNGGAENYLLSGEKRIKSCIWLLTVHICDLWE